MVFPLIRRYGGVVVGLTLDEKGIPETAEGRAEIAGRIIDEAARYGIPRKDIVIDVLTMTISSEPHGALIALEALKLVEERYGVKTSLGVSNISFGLPARPFINAAFYTMAMQQGLSAAIINPGSEDMSAYGVLLVVLNVALGATIAIVSTVMSKKHLDKQENYFTAGRNVKTALMIATFISYAVGTGLLFAPAESAYTTGLTAMIGYALAISAAYIVFIPVSVRIRKLIPEGHTIGEYAKTRYGPVMKAFSSIRSVSFAISETSPRDRKSVV